MEGPAPVSILVGTTLTTYAMSDPDAWGSWLRNAEQVRDSTGLDVSYFAAIETDARGLEPFQPLTDRLSDLWHAQPRSGEPFLEFQLRDSRTEVTQANRLPHITL